MESVLLPMEPVEPRIANFFTSFIFSGTLFRRGYPPCIWGYFGRKSSVFSGLRRVGVCKIFILNGLWLKYWYGLGYGLNGEAPAF